MLRCPLLHGIVPGICTNCNGKQIDSFTGGPHYKKAAKDQAMKKATKRAGQAMQALDSNNRAFAGQLQLASGSKPTLALGQPPRILQNIQRFSEDMNSFFNKMYKPNDYITGI
ncbi:hypothetical protein ACLKA7_000011 [Drosophila subpalustris]